MDNLSNIKFSAWRDDNRTMCSLRAEVPGSKLGYISFYFTSDEFRDFALCKRDAFTDIGHNLRTFGDSCTFFNLDFPCRENHGVAEVPFIHANIPTFVRQVLLGWAERRWKEESHRDRPEISISAERAKRWVKLYGCGQGQAKLDMNDTTKNYLEERLKEESNLRENLDRLLIIARNGTHMFFETGKVQLSKDWDGFYFQIMSPSGRCTMNGGVVDHGRDGEHDWSIHT